MSAPAESVRYFAFISYSHRDQRWADWLHKALETYRVPRRLVGQTTSGGVIPPRIAPIFRDRDELASSSDLGRTVNAALAQSRNLIVICSPASAQSRWVNEEVLAFKRLGGSDRIFCCIADGEPNATELPGLAAEECFAPALRFTLDASGKPTNERTEPIAADAREGKDGKANAKLKLVAGMLDVGFDALKQREQQRRNRRMAIVTAAALVIMAITTTLAITAVIARKDAERRQKQAEDLVNFMLGDLHDKLSEVQRLDIMEAVDNQAMKYFESLSTSDVTDEALQQRAKALERIGTVRMDQGHSAEALEAFRAALSVSTALCKAAPADVKRRVARSRLLAYIGMLAWSQGNLEEAQKNFEQAEEALGDSISREPVSAEALFQLTSLDNNIGHVLEVRGHLEEAANSYRAMLAHCKQLVARKSVTAEWQVQLGAAHNNLGKLALTRGQLFEAVVEYRKDETIENDLAAASPNDNNQKEKVAIAKATVGRTLASVGRYDAGIRLLREAVAISTRLEAIDAANTSFKEDVALYSMQLGKLLRQSGIPEGENLITRAAEGFRNLVDQDPSNAFWVRGLAEAEIEQARFDAALGANEKAQQGVEKALVRLKARSSSDAPDAANAPIVYDGRLLMASLAEDPLSAKEQRLAVLQGLETSGREDLRFLALRVEVLLGLARESDARQAIEHLRKAGYRDLDFVRLLNRHQIRYTADPEFEERLEAVIGSP